MPESQDRKGREPFDYQPIHVQELPPQQKVLRNLIYGIGAAICFCTLYVLISWSFAKPPRPALNAPREVMDNYRDEREAAASDAEKAFTIIISTVLLPSFTALVGYFVGVKSARHWDAEYE